MLTTSTIVQLCAKTAALSSNQAGLTTADFLALGDLVVSTLASEIMAAREEHLIFSETIPVTIGNPMVRIPYRALNGIVRHLWYEDGSGSRQRLWPRSIEQMDDYSVNSSGSPDSFYVMGNYLAMLPTPDRNGNLIVAYPFRPSSLTDASNAQQISAIVGNTITVPNIPASWVSGAQFDVIDHKAGNAILGYDLIGSISASTITFPRVVPNMQIGNFIAPAGFTPVPMLPEEAHNLLLEQIVLRIEIIRGNAQRIKNSASIVQDARRAFDGLLANRIISKPHAAGGTSPHLPRGLRPY